MGKLVTYALGICMLGAAISACKTGTEATKNDCKQDLRVANIQILHANDTGDARYFYLATTPAKSTCEAHYVFTFRWANPDSAKARSRPPLADLEHAFAPGGLEGLLFYFPHPAEEYDPTGGNEDWFIDFNIGNKNSSNDTTVYTVFSTLKSGTPQSDSVRIYAWIEFTGVGK